MSGTPLIARRQHPELAERLSFLCRRGEITALLPGVYTVPHLAEDWEIRAAAACLFDPAAVIVGDAAAGLSYWPELEPDVVWVAGRRSTVQRPGFRFITRSIPHDLVMERTGLRFTVPALTALDQIPHRGGDGIDRALRSRMTTLAQMREVFNRTPGRRGNHDRRLILLDSRDEPWSAAERLAHRVLREAGITGWRANVRVESPGGVYFLDIAFRDSPVAIEIDSREFHGDGQFESDRRRGNELLLAGRLVPHFTWRMLTEEPAMVVRTIRRALAMTAEAGLGRAQV
jgi:very-short-patch-repair endonuclease